MTPLTPGDAEFRIVIPARLGSTRLPRKVLRELGGKPLVRWVWEAAVAAGASEVIIATDSEEVQQACRQFGAAAQLTLSSHQSGTDRVNEIARKAGWPDDAVVVNLQGDEPQMPPALIRQAAQLLVDDREADIATLAHALHSREDWVNPNFVKVVRNTAGRALYFSRAPIPWKRDGVHPESPLPAGLALRHIGLYAYRVGGLRRMAGLQPAELEDCEALEQLRALANGLHIAVGIVDGSPPRGVDTEDDLIAVAATFASGPAPPYVRATG